MNYQILYKTVQGHICICCETDSRGKEYGFTITEEQAKARVASLAEVGITATYEPINENHWVNNWIG